MTNELITRAQAGEQGAFRELVAPYERELQVHCYRFLGSVHDAEDVWQDTLLAAWQGLPGFEGRASIRTWLYRVATNRCLNALRSRKRRAPTSVPMPDVDPPEPTRLSDVAWLEPYPDVLLEGLPDRPPGPEARYETIEATSLAFVTALQILPPRQRAVLILRDVLGFTAREVASMLDTTDESVTSALKRARSTVQRRFAATSSHPPAPSAGSPAEQVLVGRFASALETNDVDGIVTLLTDDVWLTMPPLPLEYQGRDLVARFFDVVAFRPGRHYRVVPTRANGQPALGVYVRDPHADLSHANGLIVLTLAGDHISTLTRFETSLFDRFGLPRTLPDQDS